jgi:hypothetical protein
MLALEGPEGNAVCSRGWRVGCTFEAGRGRRAQINRGDTEARRRTELFLRSCFDATYADPASLHSGRTSWPDFHGGAVLE